MSVGYVVDASIVMQYFLNEEHTLNAKALFQRILQQEELWIPESCLLECTNVVWKHVRFNNMEPARAEKMIDDLTAFPFSITSLSALLPRSLQIGLVHQLAVYVALYIALAEKYKVPLITADQSQARGAVAAKVEVKPITDFASVDR